MPPRYCVQTTNQDARPPRFEWLASEPSFDPESDELTGLKWTSDPEKAHDFGNEGAGKWAPLIEGASCVRFGDAPAEESTDFGAKERERVAEARRKHGDTLREAAKAEAQRAEVKGGR